MSGLLSKLLIMTKNQKSKFCDIASSWKSDLDWFHLHIFCINIASPLGRFEVLDEEPGDDEEGGGQR